MATHTERAGGSYFNGFRLGSWALHAASWLTTYWLCEWIGDPTTDQGRAAVVLISLILEFFVLHKMKKLLFDSNKRNDGLGWAGVIIDTIINAGGAFPKMGRLASWPPLAALVGAFGVDTNQGKPGNIMAAFMLAVVLGAILSYAPIRLGHEADQQ